MKIKEIKKGKAICLLYYLYIIIITIFSFMEYACVLFCFKLKQILDTCVSLFCHRVSLCEVVLKLTPLL